MSGLSICVLANGDRAALDLTVGAVTGLGAVVVGAVEHTEAPRAVDVFVTMPIETSIGEAWDRLLRTAPTDQCMLLHPGELLVAGDPTGCGARECIVIDQPSPFALADRLGTVRVVDRRAARVDGVLRPRLDLTSEPSAVDSPVILDSGSTIGDEYKGWLQFLGSALDDSEEPAEIVELAAMLAATGEHDAAMFRITNVLGALDGDVARRAARLLAFSALHRGRASELRAGVRRWATVTDHPGPPLAVHGLYLAQQQRTAGAIASLEQALHLGLVDEDGVAVDETWVQSALSDAKLRFKRYEAAIGTELQRLKGERPNDASVDRLREPWVRTGQPLSKLHGLAKPDTARRLVAKVMTPFDDCEPAEALELAESLTASPGTPTLSNDLVELIHRVAASGDLSLDDAARWTDAMVTARVSAPPPLLIVAMSPAYSPVTKVLAAAVAYDRFAVVEGLALLKEAAHAVHPCALGGTLARLATGAPKGVVPFLEAAGGTRERRALLADVLEGAGAPDLAADLRAEASVDPPSGDQSRVGMA